MLILDIDENKGFHIGDDIYISFTKVKQNKVTLKIDAPISVKIGKPSKTKTVKTPDL